MTWIFGLLLGSSSPAQFFNLDWFTLDGGGGESGDGFFELAGTVGQADAGPAADTNGFFQLEGGFWPAALPAGPFITTQPASVVTDFGMDVAFVVVASGNEPLRFQWRRNGVNLVGQTNAALLLTGVSLALGGRYEVVVENGLGSIISEAALLQFNLPITPPGDDFDNAVPIAPANTLFTADNVGATRQANEPYHAGKLGEHSVWYTWIAPATGIATFRTVGSGFDTLVGVYTGADLNSLTPVAGDDDSDTNLASEVTFNAVNGTVYRIAVDGLGLGQGFFVIGWEFEATVETVPIITLQPRSRAALQGGSATFSVEATGRALTFQWFFNRALIPGATSSNYTVVDVQRSRLGYYSVRVTNEFLRPARSRSAVLQIGAVPDVLVHDKLADAVFAAIGAGPLAPGGALASLAQIGFASVSVGGIGGQAFSNKDSSSDGCANCPVNGGVDDWFILQAESDGLMTIDTLGSDFDTILGVYHYTNDPNRYCDAASFIRCDNNGAPDGLRSLVTFPAVAGAKYLVGVDGVAGAVGAARLNWMLCLPKAPFSTSPTGGLQLTVDTNGIAGKGFTYTWRRNGIVLGQSMDPTFSIAEIPTAGVNYSVIISNPLKKITNSLGAFLSVSHGFNPANRRVRLQLSGITTQQFAVEIATPLATEFNCNRGLLWFPTTDFLAETQGVSGSTSIRIDLPTKRPVEFFRVRPLPHGARP